MLMMEKQTWSRSQGRGQGQNLLWRRFDRLGTSVRGLPSPDGVFARLLSSRDACRPLVLKVLIKTRGRQSKHVGATHNSARECDWCELCFGIFAQMKTPSLHQQKVEHTNSQLSAVYAYSPVTTAIARLRQTKVPYVRAVQVALQSSNPITFKLLTAHASTSSDIRASSPRTHSHLQQLR